MTRPYLSTEKKKQLDARMLALGIQEADLIEKFVLGSGKGGQKVNKTSSCVYLKHVPTGEEVKSSGSRSRDLNRHLARRELCDRIEEQIKGAASRRRQEIEKIRRQKRRRTRRQKQRMLEEKRHIGEKKQRRRPVDPGMEG